MTSSISLAPILVLLFVCAHVQAVTDCADIECLPGFRCEESICIRQENEAKKKICTFEKDALLIKCTNRDYQCVYVSNVPACGYSSEGVKKDFSNDCEPCLDSTISFYYGKTCSKAPQVCNENEQCINGNCVKLFNEDKYKNYKSCSSSAQCRRIVEKCVAGKCVKLTQMASTLRTANIPQPV